MILQKLKLQNNKNIAASQALVRLCVNTGLQLTLLAPSNVDISTAVFASLYIDAIIFPVSECLAKTRIPDSGSTNFLRPGLCDSRGTERYATSLEG